MVVSIVNTVSACVENEPWVFYRGAEYYLASQAFPWEFVLFACTMMGADLLSLHSKEELVFIKERMMKVGKHTQCQSGVYLSFHRQRMTVYGFKVLSILNTFRVV